MAFSSGGWGVFFLVFAVEAVTAFLVAAIVSSLLVHLAILRPRRESAPTAP